MVRPDSVWQMSMTPQLPPIPLAQASAMLRAMAQTSGSRVEAKVIGPLPNGATQVEIGRQVMSLQLPAPQPPGTTLTLALQQVEGQVRMTLISALPPPTGPNISVPAPVSAPATSIQLSAAALAAPPAPMQINTATGTVAAGTVAGASTAAQGTPLQTVAPSPARSETPNAAPASSAATVNVAGRPAMPYPVAAPAAPMTTIASNAGSATAALPPLSQPLAATPVGQHAPPANGPASPAAPLANPTPAEAAGATPVTPQAALTQMVQQALARQDSVVGLTTALTQVVARVAFPEPVMKAAQQVLGQTLSLDNGGPTAAALQKAIRGSGIFQEAMLAGGLVKAAGADMKSALLGLQRQLGAWLGDQAPVEQVRTIPPPLRGMTPRARLDTMPLGDLPDDPQSAGKMLLERTEAALSRLRLHQNASLPEPVSRHEAQWSLDLPVVFGGQQSLLHIQIHRDRDCGPEQSEERGWQVRFAINLADLGEVGAQISLRGTATGVLLWAERDETSSVLADNIATLRHELEGLGLNPGAIVVRAGPPSQTSGAVALSGHIVDAVR